MHCLVQNAQLFICQVGGGTQESIGLKAMKITSASSVSYLSCCSEDSNLL
jgi:hypothetical protein